MTEPSDPHVLTQVKQYQFVRELGRGGMGAVYEAIDNRDGGRVAVKLLHPWLAAEDPSFRDRFEREAHIAALLRSPYSVRLLDFGVVDGTYFLVMEYVEGTNVGKELEKGPLEPVRALRIAIDVARALEEASARGVVHRDIKPDNIMLTTDGRVKLTDFGIARQEGGTGLTSAGRFVGTPEYAAPEQAVGDADHRSDIYSLGATLYCMLTGQPPFHGATVWELLREHQTAQLSMEPLAQLPDTIGNPLRRCMEKDPRDRYQTATELAGALERALATYLQSGKTATGARPAARPAPPPGAAAPAGPGDLATHVAPSAPPAGPAATRVAQAAPGAGLATVTMAAVLTGEGPAGVSRYELTITNAGSVAMRVALAGIEPTGALTIAVPSPVTLRGGETQRLPVEARQVRPGAAGPLQFQLSASRDDGSRAGFVNVRVAPTGAVPAGKKGPNWLLMGAGGAAVVAVAAAAFALLGGGTSKDKTPGTGTTMTATSSTTTTPSTAGPSIKVLESWDYNFRVTANSCPFGAPVGGLYAVSFRFKPATGDGNVIREGDKVSVSTTQANVPPLGTFTFRFQDFVFTYPVKGGDGPLGEATLRTTFADASTIATAELTEKYTSPSCAISLRMAAN